MRTNRKLQPKGAEPLAWRPTNIRHWRKFHDMSQQEVSDALAGPRFNIVYTRESVGRVETGEQLPSIALIEALAHLYKTDIHSLLNRLPTIPVPPAQPDTGELAKLWGSADAETRRKLLRIAKTMIGAE